MTPEEVEDIQDEIAEVCVDAKMSTDDVIRELSLAIGREVEESDDLLETLSEAELAAAHSHFVDIGSAHREAVQGAGTREWRVGDAWDERPDSWREGLHKLYLVEVMTHRTRGGELVYDEKLGSVIVDADGYWDAFHKARGTWYRIHPEDSGLALATVCVAETPVFAT